MRPMLASTPTQDVLEKHLSETFLFVSAKLDGIRALTTATGLVSRTLKPIRNKHIQKTLAGLPLGLDGELIVGRPNVPDTFNRTTSGVMSGGGEPDFKYYVFDCWNSQHVYANRWQDIQGLNYPNVILLMQHYSRTMRDIDTHEQTYLSLGYEGVIVRRPDAPYKFNRATNREGYLMKVKRYDDAEAEIIGFKQKMHNANEARPNKLGLTSRSTSKEHKEPLEQVGAFMVRDLKTGVEFQVHGFTHANAAKWWLERETLLGKIITYKHLPIGAINAPRHGIFKGFRDPIDL